MQVWEKDEEGIWVNVCKLGQVFGNSNAYFGITSNEKGSMVVSWTFTGAAYCWEKKEEWQIKSLFSGHCKKVTDVRWGNNGNLLFSCSKD